MFVTKRSGKTENVFFDKITSRIKYLCVGLTSVIDPVAVTQIINSGLYSGVNTRDIDDLAANICSQKIVDHPDYDRLATRLLVSNLHKETDVSFCNSMLLLSTIMDKQFLLFVQEHAKILDTTIDHERDYAYTFFGLKTLQKSYLLQKDRRIVERPQYLLMRVAIAVHMPNLEACLKSYRYMSDLYFTHASPTLFNAGTTHNQMSSCFLLDSSGDSIDGIYKTLGRCAMISKYAGGIGLAISDIRAKGSLINGSGISEGIVPMLRVFNETCRYVNQGGRRKGAFAIYIEPWHADILDFLQLKKNHGDENTRARDLFYGLWIPDLFMQRVEENAMWSLMCPKQCPGLSDVFGTVFDDLYIQYEKHEQFVTQIPARRIWEKIIQAQIETGTPYMIYKDSVNKKNNQKNLGTIKCSNLCTEIMEFSSPTECAVCNLASISVPKFVTNGIFNYDTLFEVVCEIVFNLNLVIDKTLYPLPDGRVNNFDNRPIGIGIQGLAEVFMDLGISFESTEAFSTNRYIFETIYFAALSASNKLAQRDGVYAKYIGSPISEGYLQFDLWGVEPRFLKWDWASLRVKIRQYGVRNSLLVAPMPTASTSQILGNTESFEPIHSNIYVRRTLAGEFMCVNKRLQTDLLGLGLWNDQMKNTIIQAKGSIQHISIIPLLTREKFKTVWEVSQKRIVDMAVDRAPFIDQSQSLNIHMAVAQYSKITSMHFYTWKSGLKTGMYYLRTQSAADAIQFTQIQAPVLECISCGS